VFIAGGGVLHKLLGGSEAVLAHATAVWQEQVALSTQAQRTIADSSLAASAGSGAATAPIPATPPSAGVKAEATLAAQRLGRVVEAYRRGKQRCWAAFGATCPLVFVASSGDALAMAGAREAAQRALQHTQPFGKNEWQSPPAQSAEEIPHHGLPGAERGQAATPPNNKRKTDASDSGAGKAEDCIDDGDMDLFGCKSNRNFPQFKF
jgi:hypothetical protein